MPFIVPGIGYAGLGQQTAAAQQVFRQAMGGGPRRAGVRRRNSKGPKTRTARGRARASLRRATQGRRRSNKASRFVKGSAAAKRHMAKLRKMRRR